MIGNLNHLLVMLKGLPSTYNRDLQEDKLALFDSVETVEVSLEGIREMIEDWVWVPERAESSLKNGFATATDLADFLVYEKKVPFRTAHELVGTLVRVCVEQKRPCLICPNRIELRFRNILWEKNTKMRFLFLFPRTKKSLTEELPKKDRKNN